MVLMAGPSRPALAMSSDVTVHSPRRIAPVILTADSRLAICPAGIFGIHHKGTIRDRLVNERDQPSYPRYAVSSATDGTKQSAQLPAALRLSPMIIVLRLRQASLTIIPTPAATSVWSSSKMTRMISASFVMVMNRAFPSALRADCVRETMSCNVCAVTKPDPNRAQDK